MNWICLSKNGEDEYIDMFARGAGLEPTALETWNYEDSMDPLILRGIMKHKIIKRCWQDKRFFWYMDSGYLGNRPSIKNPHGWKHWHRIVPNDLQHDQIIPRPADRLQRLELYMRPYHQHSRDILIVAPDHKPCAFYGFELDDWLTNVKNELQMYTDRPVKIRERPASRMDRKTQRAEDWLSDVHAVVTFNSTAATEAILAGVPVFTTAPCNAANPMSNHDLSKIEEPWFPTDDQRHAWLCHLAYGQFHIDEFKNGMAYRILKQTQEMING